MHAQSGTSTEQIGEKSAETLRLFVLYDTCTKKGLNSLQSLISCLLRQLSLVRWADNVPGIHVSGDEMTERQKKGEDRGRF